MLHSSVDVVREGEELEESPEEIGLDPKSSVIPFPRVRTAGDLLADNTLVNDYIVEGLLCPEWVLVIGGYPKTRKTWLSLDLALSLASGNNFLAHQVPKPLSVLYLGAEGSEKTLRKRLKLFEDEFKGKPSEVFDRLKICCTQGRIKIDTRRGEEYVRRISEGSDVVIIDPCYRFVTKGSENHHEDQRAMHDALDRLKYLEKAIVLVHHLRKPIPNRARNFRYLVASELRGAGLDAYADSILINIPKISGKQKGEPGLFTLHYTLRHDEEPAPVELVADGPFLRLANPLESGKAKRMVSTVDVERVIEQEGGLIRGQGALVDAIRKATGASESTAIRAVRDAKDSRIQTTHLPGRGAPLVYTLKDISCQERK